MSQKAIIIADPGIDTAFAIALALNDPDIELVGLLATAGNVAADQATHNVRVILEQIDPPRWPKVGAALSVLPGVAATSVHGPGGLGGVTFPVAKRDDPVAGDKVLIDLVRESAGNLTVLNLGPLTLLARAMERDPETASLVRRIVCLGGVCREPGDAGLATEFHLAFDSMAARSVIRCGAPITMIPLDVSRQLVFSPSDLLNLPEPEARTCQFLRQIVPFGIRATANWLGVEGFHLCDVLGVIALTRPATLTLRPASVEVETRGELTSGMSLIDWRRPAAANSTVDVATDVDVPAVRMYIKDVLGASV